MPAFALRRTAMSMPPLSTGWVPMKRFMDFQIPRSSFPDDADAYRSLTRICSGERYCDARIPYGDSGLHRPHLIRRGRFPRIEAVSLRVRQSDVDALFGPAGIFIGYRNTGSMRGDGRGR